MRARVLQLMWTFVAAIMAIGCPGALARPVDSLYVGLGNNNPATWSVAQFSIGSDGRLIAKSPASASAPNPVRALAMTPDAQTLFAATDAGVARYSVGADGTLTQLATTTAVGSASGLAVSPDGATLYVLNGSEVFRFTIGSGGALSFVQSSRLSVPAGINRLVLNLLGTRAYAIGNQAVVSQFAVSSDGALSPLSPATIASGTTPSDLALSANGRNLYVTATGSNNVSQYVVAVDGRLASASPASLATGLYPFNVVPSRDGQNVYVDNAISNSLSQFSAASDGLLTPKSPPSAASGADPTALALAPDGRTIYAAITQQNLVQTFRPDALGRLTADFTSVGSTVSGPRALVTTIAPPTAPIIDISAPVDGATYAPDDVPHAVFACSATTRGAEIQSCDGDVATGSAVDESLGVHTLTVRAESSDGLVSTKSVSYRVADQTPPVIDIYRPAEGAHYPAGQWVQSSFSCIDDVDGFLFNCQGNANWPAAFDTSTPGEHTFTVTGTDNSGNTASKTVHYTVDALELPPGRLIAYEGNDGLYFATDDATHAVRVGVPGRYSGGDFSPDGTQFAYAVSRPTYDGVESELRIRNLDGSNDRRVILQARGDVGLPRFSPDGTQLSYVSQDPDTLVQSVWTVSVSGASPRQRTHSGGATAAYDWAPDGEHLVLNQSSDHAYGFDVALLDLRDDSIRLLTDRPGNEIWGRYSVDGKRIYYIVNPGVPSGQVYQLWSIKPDGTDDQRVAALTGDHYGTFAFSPDGESLIYSTSGDRADLARVDLATGASTNLTNTSGFQEYLSAWQGPRRPTDEEAPVVEVSAPRPDGEANWFVSAPVTVSVHVIDNRAIEDVTCRIDGDIVNLALDGLGTTDASAQFNVSGDGQRRVSCRAHDANANASAIADLDLAIDTARPSVSCDPADPTQWYASDVTVSCSAADTTSLLLHDGDAAFVLATDVPDGTTDSSATTPEREICDRAGLCTKTGPFRFKIDRRNPSIVFDGDQPRTGAWHRTAPIVQARAADANIATLTCTLDGTPTAAAVPTDADLLASTTVDTDGRHELACTARDQSGRETVARTSVRVDRHAPDTTCGVPAGWSAQNPEVVCISTDADSGLADEADGRLVLTSAVADGAEDPSAETSSRSVCDVAGNCRIAGPYRVAVDRKLPTLLLTQAPNGSAGWWTSRATIGVSAADASLSSVACAVDGAPYFTESAATRTAITREISIVPEGRHTVGCTARDSVSRTSDATANVQLDQTPPLAPQLTASRAPDTADGEAWFEDSVTVAAVDRGDPVLADGAPGSGTEPASMPAPRAYTTEGVFTVTGAASDLAGNRSIDTTVVVRVDTGSPTSQLTCPQSPSLGTTATASFTDADTGSGLLGKASGTFPVDTSTVGAHETQHQAVDRVGHITSRSCTYTVVDRTAPTVTCASSDGQWHNTNVSLACVAEDAGGLDSASDAAFALSTTVAANTTDGDAATGSRTVCDRAGNCRVAGPILHNRIDRTAPTVTIHTNLLGVPDGAACTDESGGSGVAQCSNVDEATPVLNLFGLKILINHKFTATARDRAGNVTTKTMTYTTLL